MDHFSSFPRSVFELKEDTWPASQWMPDLPEGITHVLWDGHGASWNTLHPHKDWNGEHAFFSHHCMGISESSSTACIGQCFYTEVSQLARAAIDKDYILSTVGTQSQQVPNQTEAALVWWIKDITAKLIPLSLPGWCYGQLYTTLIGLNVGFATRLTPCALAGGPPDSPTSVGIVIACIGG